MDHGVGLGRVVARGLEWLREGDWLSAPRWLRAAVKERERSAACRTDLGARRVCGSRRGSSFTPATTVVIELLALVGGTRPDDEGMIAVAAGDWNDCPARGVTAELNVADVAGASSLREDTRARLARLLLRRRRRRGRRQRAQTPSPPSSRWSNAAHVGISANRRLDRPRGSRRALAPDPARGTRLGLRCGRLHADGH